MVAPETPAADPAAAEAFFRDAATGAVVLNRVRRALAVNPAGAQITGWSPRELGQASCRSWSCRDEHGKPLCADACFAQRAIEGGTRIGPLYLKLTAADGRAVACEATFVPLRPDDPRGGTCLALLQDVTLLEGLDRAVRARDEQIVEMRLALRALGQQVGATWRTTFAELRTSLAGLRGQPKSDADRAKLLDRAQRASEGLEGFFAQALTRLRGSGPPPREQA